MVSAYPIEIILQPGAVAYWVHEDAEQKGIRVHLSTCPQASPQQRCKISGRWHGPFMTQSAALISANNLVDGSPFRWCRICGQGESAWRLSDSFRDTLGAVKHKHTSPT